MNRDDDDAPAGFLARWSRRKVQVRQGVAPPEPAPEPVQTAEAAPAAAPVAAAPARLAPLPAPPRPVSGAQPPPEPAAPAEVEPPPTLADAAALPRGADVRRFVAPGVAPDVRNAALKKLFADPHFNVMDGLDTYIDDYGKPDPLPAGMLRQMVQGRMLGLFKDEDEAQAKADAQAAAAAHGTVAAAAAPDTDPPDTGPPDQHALPAAAPATAALDPASPPLAPVTPATERDEDPDLRLQPLDAAGPGRPAPGPGPDPGRQH